LALAMPYGLKREYTKIKIMKILNSIYKISIFPGIGRAKATDIFLIITPA
jgi:hypothetical protein